MGSSDCMEHVSGLEKYECVIWKVCMTLFRIDDGSVWWLWMRADMGGSRIGSGVMYQLMRRRISIAKSCTNGGRV
jgi:hypothetical protein